MPCITPLPSLHHLLPLYLLALCWQPLPTLAQNAGTDPATDCAALAASSHAASQNMDYQAFDQTQQQGWRVLQDAGCFAEAENLMQAFAASHTPENERARAALQLHIGQMQLRQDKRSAAARSFRQAVRADGDGAFKFNDFALALAAWAENQPQAFARHQAVLRSAQDNPGNRINLRLLDAMEAHFGQPYNLVLQVMAARATAP